MDLRDEQDKLLARINELILERDELLKTIDAARDIMASDDDQIEKLATERAAAINLLLTSSRTQTLLFDGPIRTWATVYQIGGIAFLTEKAALAWILDQIRPIPTKATGKGTCDVHLPRE